MIECRTRCSGLTYSAGRSLRPRQEGGTCADSHAALAASAAISLFTRCTVPLPMPTIAATFTMPFPALGCVLMAFSITDGGAKISRATPGIGNGRIFAHLGKIGFSSDRVCAGVYLNEGHKTCTYPNETAADGDRARSNSVGFNSGKELAVFAINSLNSPCAFTKDPDRSPPRPPKTGSGVEFNRRSYPVAGWIDAIQFVVSRSRDPDGAKCHSVHCCSRQ
jgi:hypothetical protein